MSTISFHSADELGQGNRLSRINGRSIRIARVNRAAANVIGGRSVSPIFMKIHVVPQSRHRITQTRMFMFHSSRSSGVSELQSFLLFLFSPRELFSGVFPFVRVFFRVFRVFRGSCRKINHGIHRKLEKRKNQKEPPRLASLIKTETRISLCQESPAANVSGSVRENIF